MKATHIKGLTVLTLGTVLVIAGAMMLIRRFAADRLPLLDQSTFLAAREAWIEQRPSDYRITTEVTGRQPATYTVEVRGGQALNAMRNGQPLQDTRTFKTWTVDGMFGTMEYDVDRNAEAAASPPLYLGARFDPVWQFPAEYLRIEWGTSFEVAWRVTEFTLLSAFPDETAP